MHTKNETHAPNGGRRVEQRVQLALLALVIDATAPELFADSGRGIDPDSLTLSDLDRIIDHYGLSVGELFAMIAE